MTDSNGSQFLKIARSTAQIALRSPAGTRIEITIDARTTAEDVAGLLAAALMADQVAQDAGWSAADDGAHEPAASASASAAKTEPTFCGYPCSRTYDDAGRPAWIIVDGRQAHRRDRQGDTWWSYADAAGAYTRVLLIRKGEKAPGIDWPAGMEPTTK